MAIVSFTRALARFHAAPPVEVGGTTLRAALDAAFAAQPVSRGYVLDEQGALRRHVTVYINDRPANDRTRLTDAVASGDQVYVFQALSGG